MSIDKPSNQFNRSSRRFHIGAVMSVVTGKYFNDHMHKRKTQLLAHMTGLPENTPYKDLQQHEDKCATYLETKFPAFKNMDADLAAFLEADSVDTHLKSDPFLRLLFEKTQEINDASARQTKALIWLKLKEAELGETVNVPVSSRLDIEARQTFGALGDSERAAKTSTHYSPATGDLYTLNLN